MKSNRSPLMLSILGCLAPAASRPIITYWWNRFAINSQPSAHLWICIRYDNDDDASVNRQEEWIRGITNRRIPISLSLNTWLNDGLMKRSQPQKRRKYLKCEKIYNPFLVVSCACQTYIHPNDDTHPLIDEPGSKKVQNPSHYYALFSLARAIHPPA
jgi:hypothetical protein